MNWHFNLSRFGRLLRRHTAEHSRSYLMGTAVLLGGLLVVLGTLTYLTGRPLDQELQMVMFMFGLLGAGAVFTSSVFAAVGDRRQAAPALLLPASHLEKYLVVWLYSLPVFLVVYTASFLAIDALVLAVGNNGHPHPLLNLTDGLRPAATAILSYALLHAVALWGAIYFERLHVIKTAFAFFGLLIVLMTANFQLLKAWLTPEVGLTVPFGEVHVPVDKHYFLLELPAGQTQLLLVLLPLGLAALLWLAAYARLTEKQL
ncbi:hypothetical protein [Hymenobacter terricola]|uniref:hypothetical protein n=1 Tax=Hymenobacter terricola TaxID=2819236 RepID=UPI001B316ED1|nr:hypothetical protein [Hymenobacter terricola]